MRCPRMVNTSAVARTMESSMAPSKVPLAGMTLLCSSEPMRRKPSEMVVGSDVGMETSGAPLSVSVAGCNHPEPESTPGLPVVRWMYAGDNETTTSPPLKDTAANSESCSSMPSFTGGARNRRTLNSAIVAGGGGWVGGLRRASSVHGERDSFRTKRGVRQAETWPRRQAGRSCVEVPRSGRKRGRSAAGGRIVKEGAPDVWKWSKRAKVPFSASESCIKTPTELFLRRRCHFGYPTELFLTGSGVGADFPPLAGPRPVRGERSGRHSLR